MKTIDLTSPKSAMKWLLSLDQDMTVSLPDTAKGESNEYGDAVRAITGSNPRDFVICYNQWDWTVGELVTTLEAEDKHAITFEVTYNGNDKQADGNGPSDVVHDLEEATKIADHRAKGAVGHIDFVGGCYEVWKQTEDGAELVHSTGIIGNGEPNIGEIISVSAVHGESPSSVDVSVRNAAMVRVALGWEHVDDKGELTDAATAHIEDTVKSKGGFDEVVWSINA